MDEKPIVIIGGGLWGTLLALRIKGSFPHLSVRLYEKGPSLGEKLAVSFYESDVSPNALDWLSPLISRKWDQFEVKFPKFGARNSDSVYTMEPHHFHQSALKILGRDVVRLNTVITPEEASKVASVVIDTKCRGHFKALGYQKSHGLVVRLQHNHDLKFPVIMDATVDQKNCFRYIQLLPLADNMVLLKDVRFSSNAKLQDLDLENDLQGEICRRNWFVGDILERDTEFRKIPSSSIHDSYEGSIIRLDHIIHDITGDAIPDAIRLIDRMVQTSFRVGELKKVLRNYAKERKTQRRNLRVMNRVLYQARTPGHERYRFFEILYSMPSHIRRKFYKGDLDILELIYLLLRRQLRLTKFQLNKRMPILPRLLTEARSFHD